MSEQEEEEDIRVLAPLTSEDRIIIPNPLDFNEHRRHVDLIKNFRVVIGTENFNIKPSWKGMNISPITRDMLEVQIQADRVIEVLSHLVRNLKTIGALEYLLHDDGALLYKYMQKDQADYVMNMCGAGLMPFTRIKQKTLTGDYIDKNLEIAMDYIDNNHCISQYIRKFRLPLDPFTKDFRSAINQFINIISIKVRTSAAQYRERESLLKVAFQNHKERLINMRRLKEKLQEQVKDTSQKMIEKEALIKKYKAKIADVKQRYKDKIDRMVYESEKKMMMIGDASLVEQQQLAADAKEAQHTYQVILEDHLISEKVLRAKRLKVEAQLATWIEKYDKDVTERQNNLEELTEQMDAEREELAELECLISEQHNIYEEYKAEKEAEDEMIMMEKTYYIRANRAARIIQRAWRAYRARKMRRRKQKKGKKGKKGSRKGSPKKGGKKDKKKKKK